MAGTSRGAPVCILRGEVAERSNAADCKSVALAASEVRILPSPPIALWAGGGSRGETGRAEVAKMCGAGAGAGIGAKAGGSNSVVESQPSKLLVAGSIPVSRSTRFRVTASAQPALSGAATCPVQTSRGR